MSKIIVSRIKFEPFSLNLLQNLFLKCHLFFFEEQTIKCLCVVKKITFKRNCGEAEER